MNPLKTTQVPWGKIDNKSVDLYTLSNNNGVEIKITNFGGIVTSWITPDKNGTLANIVAGFDTLDHYIKDNPFFGALIGRYANRIAKGKFTLDGSTYSLATNNAENHLHGGHKGFGKVVWDAEILPDQSLKLSYLSINGEEGYPGNLKVTVCYSLNNDNELRIEYSGETDQTTVINLTSHSYFNLSGDFNNKVYDQLLTIKANHYTPMDETNIPTGIIENVEGTALDFRKPTAVGSRIKAMGMGYDDNLVLNNQDNSLALVAELYDPHSGRKLDTFTTEPGLQFYTGNYLDGTLTTSDGVPYTQHSALCLETQHYPDSPNKPAFPTTVLRPGEKFKSITVYKTSVA